MRSTPRQPARLTSTLFCLVALGAYGAPEDAADSEASAAAAAAQQGTALMEHLGARVDLLGEKMVSLAEAMPDEDCGWRPMEGVTTDGATVGAYEEAARSDAKADVVAGLADSFRYMDMALAAHRDDPGTELDLRGNTLSAGDRWVRAVTHLREHLGQSIAYARANEVVPPWSR